MIHDPSDYHWLTLHALVTATAPMFYVVTAHVTY